MNSDANRPTLNLGEPPARLRQAMGGVSRAWLVALLLLQLATLAGLGFVLTRRNGPAVANGASPHVAALKALAIELENRSLYAEAAQAWEDYLQVAPDADGQAEVLFRVGRLYMQAGQFAPAAAALVHCEQAAADDALRKKVGPELVTCLRRLGLHGEVGRELSRRVEAGAEKTEKGRVLATLAGEPITEADLDRMIERRVDQMLAMQGATGDETLRQQVLREFSQSETRQRLFQELLQTELFTRRAREREMDREPEFLAARQALDDSLLASRFQTHELAKIQPTDVDLESFYKAHEDQYKQPEAATAWIIELQAGEDPKTVLDGIKTADDFRELAKKRRASPSPESTPAPETLVRGRPHPQLGNTEALFKLEPGQWTKEPLANQERRFLVLVEGKSPARTPPLEEVRDQVRGDYVARKREELSKRLLGELMQRYEVKIEPWHSSSGTGSASPKPSPDHKE